MFPGKVSREIEFTGSARNSRAAANAHQPVNIRQALAGPARNCVQTIKADLQALNHLFQRVGGNGRVATIGHHALLLPLQILHHIGFQVGARAHGDLPERIAEAAVKAALDAGASATTAGRAGAGTAVTLIGLTTYATTIAPTIENDHQTATLAAAVQRDNAAVAMAYLIDEGGRVLPTGFKQELLGRIGRAPDTEHRGHVRSNPIVNEAVLGKPEAAALIAAARTSAREGLAAAYQQGIADEKGLAVAKQSKEFAARWHEDPAFRLGVQGAMWQAQHEPVAFAEARALNEQLRAAGGGRL